MKIILISLILWFQAVDNLLDIGYEQYDQGEFTEAVKSFNTAIEIDPNDASYHDNLGVIFVSLGENHKALGCYKKAIEINPMHETTLVNYGTLLLNINNHSKGLKYIASGEGVIKFSPTYYKIIEQ